MRDINKYVDFNDALNRVRGNKKLYKTLLQSFMNDSRMDVLVEDIKRGDMSAAAKTAHTIKGAGANLSLVELSGAVAALESILKAGGSYEDELKACLDAYSETGEAIKELLTTL